MTSEGAVARYGLHSEGCMKLASLLVSMAVLFAIACGGEPSIRSTTDEPTAIAIPSATASPPATPASTPTLTPEPASTPVPAPTTSTQPISTQPISTQPISTQPISTQPTRQVATATTAATAVPSPEPTATPPLTSMVTPTPTATAPMSVATSTPTPTPVPTSTPAPIATSTPTPTLTPIPTPEPTPTLTATATPSPTPTPAVLSSVAGYSPLLARAASSLPAQYDFVRDGLSVEEREVLDWADSRLFGNPNFLESEWGPDGWTVVVNESSGNQGRSTRYDLLSDSELRLASVQATALMMLEIEVRKKSDGRHVITWELDSLDQILDGLSIYPGMCVHCYGKTGYDTYEGIGKNYDVILTRGHVHRELLKAFAYFAKADREGILVRSFMENDADDFGMLYKRKLAGTPQVVGDGYFAYGNVSFMSQYRAA